MLETDRHLFYFFNTSLSHPFLDHFMPWITDLHKNSAALVIFFAVILLWIYQKKQKAVGMVLSLTLCVGATDLFTYRILKPSFKRPRPPAVETKIQVRTKHFAGYGFPSNHAANTFAASTLLSLYYPALGFFCFPAAALIAFSRVYVGVHYPLDVFFGSLLGFLFGFLFFKLSSLLLRKIEDYKQKRNKTAG